MSQTRIKVKIGQRPTMGTVLLASKEPLFARAEETKNGIAMYYDQDGALACVNAVVRPNARLCIVCGNCCISFIANDDGTYTCSACGKFPKELILNA